MGAPVKIIDLAKRMIHLSGFTEKNNANPDGDIEITFTGLRTGEKLYEELLIGDNVSITQHQKIMRAEEKVIEWTQLEQILINLNDASKKNNCDKIRDILVKYVDGFTPQHEVDDWLI
jgi:FlaA1/EpsC-like NDP-sugar epimerase